MIEETRIKKDFGEYKLETYLDPNFGLLLRGAFVVDTGIKYITDERFVVKSEKLSEDTLSLIRSRAIKVSGDDNNCLFVHQRYHRTREEAEAYHHWRVKYYENLTLKDLEITRRPDGYFREKCPIGNR